MLQKHVSLPETFFKESVVDRGMPRMGLACLSVGESHLRTAGFTCCHAEAAVSVPPGADAECGDLRVDVEQPRVPRAAGDYATATGARGHVRSRKL